LNRLTDDQSQPRIAEAAEAVEQIVRLLRAKTIEGLSSTALKAERNNNPDVERVKRATCDFKAPGPGRWATGNHVRRTAFRPSQARKSILKIPGICRRAADLNDDSQRDPVEAAATLCSNGSPRRILIATGSFWFADLPPGDYVSRASGPINQSVLGFRSPAGCANRRGQTRGNRNA